MGIFEGFCLIEISDFQKWKSLVLLIYRRKPNITRYNEWKAKLARNSASADFILQEIIISYGSSSPGSHCGFRDFCYAEEVFHACDRLQLLIFSKI